MSDRKHAFSPIIDALKAHNEQMIREYECFSCGEWVPGEELEDRTWFDQGERFDEHICGKCIKRGWDQWGRP
jgi:hypothetical protein